MKRSISLTTLVALLAFALGANAAAGTRPDDRAVHGPGAVGLADSSAVVRPDDRAWRGAGPAPTSVTTAAPSVRPDDRPNHGVGALVSTTPTVRPDDRAWRGAGPEPIVVPSTAPSGTVDGFDWVDAGIGASGALGLALLLAGASTLVLRRQRVAALT